MRITASQPKSGVDVDREVLHEPSGVRGMGGGWLGVRLLEVMT